MKVFMESNITIKRLTSLSKLIDILSIVKNRKAYYLGLKLLKKV